MGEATIIPSSDPKSKTMVNGNIIHNPTQLISGYRIRFGNHVFFEYVDPEVAYEKHDWEFVVKEANEAEVQKMLQ